MLTLREIAHIRSDFPEKFGIPRQSGLVSELISTVVFEPEYRVPEALRGLEMYTHVWLVWEFSKAVREDWKPTVRPPPAWRKYPHGRFRDAFAVSSESTGS